MLSKEEILMYVEQGNAQEGWQILRPDKSYLMMQLLVSGLLAVSLLGFTLYFMGQNSFVIYPPGLSTQLDPDTFQTSHTGDIVGLALGILGLAGGVINYLLQVSSVEHQVLVLMPEGFLLKKRSSEQFVRYAEISSMAPRASRYGYWLTIKWTTGKKLTRVVLDARYGKPKELGLQIMAAQRQYAANQMVSSELLG